MKDEIKEILITHRRFYGDNATYIIEDEHIKYLTSNINSLFEEKIEEIDKHTSKLIILISVIFLIGTILVHIF